ncbi:MAG: polysaccharide biosynthesis tyrosine autokinase [Cyclobacteriaceae bacterium]|nr:polysaccharide biosynthesis tyrosine autokinase [Cyclobacteriaceae bacterium]
MREENNQNFINPDAGESPMEMLDLGKLRERIIHNLPFLIILLLVCLAASYLAVRYTRPLYQSSSVLQVDVKSDAKVLGFKSFDDDINVLAREIEIIKSRLFLNQVAEALNWQVSYYQYGDILFEERYPYNPFLVHVINCPPEYYDRSIDLTLVSDNEFSMDLPSPDGEIIGKVFHFNDTIQIEKLKIVISPVLKYTREIDNRYFFRINSINGLVNYLGAALTVEPLDFKAQTITVSFKDYNRDKASHIVTAIDTLYIYYSQLEQNKSNKQRIDFLNLQLKQTEEKLSELEEYFENFTISNKTTNLDANLARTIMIMEQLDSQRFVTQKKIDQCNSLFDKVVKGSEFDLNLADLAAFSGESSEELQRLNALNEEKQQLLGSYNENTFAYQKKNEEIEFLRNRLVRYLETTRVNLYETLDQVKKRKSQLESDFVSLPGKRTEYTKTERYYTLYEEFYLSLIKNKAEFELAQAGTVTDFRILSSASSSSAHISPNKILYYSIGVVVWVFISFLFISIGYLFDNKITSQQELERISSAFVLGSIPFYTNKALKSSRLVINNNLKSEISEAFRTIRTNLEFLNGHGSKTIISITSTISGEGKTFVAINLGGIISLRGQKVLLLDLDMRKPRFQDVFPDTHTAKGLSTILINKHSIEDCIQETSVQNLHYIAAGPVPPNPSELVLGGAFESIIERVCEIYDTIIIDTPPVGLVTDGIQALKIATLPIYVFRAGHSKKTFLKNVNRLIKVNKIKNLSLILNSVKKASADSYAYGNNYYEDEKPSNWKKIRKFLPI